MADLLSSEAEPFDIRDGRNRYEPCAGCGRDFGMSLTSRGNELFVWCSACDHEGPHVRTTGPWHADDRRAFDAWNQEERTTGKAGPSDERTPLPEAEIERRYAEDMAAGRPSLCVPARLVPSRLRISDRWDEECRRDG